MSSVVISGDTSGAITVLAPAVSGTNTLTLQAGTATNSMNTLATAVTASGTSVDFTGIPAWVERITVMISGLSGSAASDFLFQLGDSGGIEATGYTGAGTLVGGGGATSATNYTTGFGFAGGGTTAKVWQGAIRFTNITGNTWIADGVFGRSDAANTAQVGGSKALSDVLTQVRITHLNGTDTFDAGTVNILYEG
jgi:hypothetical protein